jgi:hypothetical protein
MKRAGLLPLIEVLVALVVAVAALRSSRRAS